MSCLLFVAFWWKEVVFFSSFRPVQAIAVPRPVVLSTGSNGLRPYYDWAVACSVQHRAWSTLPVRSLSRCSPSVLYQCSEDLPLNCYHVATAAQLAVHKDSSGFEGNVDPPATSSCRFCLETCSCRLTMEPLRGDSVSSTTRTTGERSLQPPNPSSSPAPTSLTFGS